MMVDAQRLMEKRNGRRGERGYLGCFGRLGRRGRFVGVEYGLVADREKLCLRWL